MSPKQVANLLEQSGYVTDDSLATLVWMAMELDRPLLLEGEAGVSRARHSLCNVTVKVSRRSKDSPVELCYMQFSSAFHKNMDCNAASALPAC